jgi:Cytochrome c
MKLHTLALCALMLLAGCESTPPDTRSLESLSGAELYGRLCASCHGVMARGDGPVAPLINIAVPDLTRIAARRGGEFPTEDVRRSIDGKWQRPAHGPRDMPVWGWVFYDETARQGAWDPARVDAMLNRLVDYLRSIQVQ